MKKFDPALARIGDDKISILSSQRLNYYIFFNTRKLVNIFFANRKAKGNIGTCIFLFVEYDRV